MHISMGAISLVSNFVYINTVNNLDFVPIKSRFCLHKTIFSNDRRNL